MLALARYEADIGPCGFHKSLTSDRSNHFTFEDETCPICAGLDRYRRLQADRDEKAVKALGEKPEPLAPRPSDGRQTTVRMMTAEEVQERRERRVSRTPTPADPPARG